MQRLILVAVLLAYAPRVTAGPILTAGPATPVCDGPDCAVTLQKGEAAPYAGQLLTEQLAITLGQKADNTQRRIDLEVAYVKKTAAADAVTAEQKFQIQLQDFKYQHEHDTAELAERDAFYRRPWFLISASVVGTLIITGLAIDGAEHLRR